MLIISLQYLQFNFQFNIKYKNKLINFVNLNKKD